MDRPKINIRAWQPIEKRKKVNIPKLKNESIYLNTSLKEYDIKNLKNSSKKTIIHQEAERIEPENYYKTINNRAYNRNSESDYYNYSPNTCYNKIKNKRKKKNYFNSQILKTIGTGIGAIATGAFLGYIILNLWFNTNEDKPLTVNPSYSNNSEVINNNVNVSIVGQVIPELRKYFIQAGVFSNLSGAEAIVKQQRDSGKAAVIKQDNAYYVFVGISASKEEANLLKEVLTSENIELYTKEYVIKERKFNMKDSTFTLFKSFINSGEKLINSLSTVSSQTLLDPHKVINYEEIQKIHQDFLLDNKILKEVLDKEDLTVESELIQNMSDQINYSIAALNAYKKNPNQQYLWNIQELLIKYELYYEGYVKKN